jgi:hypothetical protein
MTHEQLSTQSEPVAKTLESLDLDVRRTLAAVHDAPADAAELALATLGYWVRVLLAEEHVMEPFEDEGERGSGSDEAKQRPVTVTLTQHGRAVLDACAELVGVDPDLESRMRRLKDAHEGYLATGEVEQLASASGCEVH